MKTFKEIADDVTTIDESYTLDELSSQDQKYIDDLLAELGKKKLSKKDWDSFFMKIMADVKKLKNERK